MKGDKHHWRKDKDGTWRLEGTTTRRAKIHYMHDPEGPQRIHFHQRDQEIGQAKPLICFNVPGEHYHAGIGQRDYAPAHFSVYRLISRTENDIVGELVCEFPIRAGMRL